MCFKHEPQVQASGWIHIVTALPSENEIQCSYLDHVIPCTIFVSWYVFCTHKRGSPWSQKITLQTKGRNYSVSEKSASVYHCESKMYEETLLTAFFSYGKPNLLAFYLKPINSVATILCLLDQYRLQSFIDSEEYSIYWNMHEIIN
jgi:hypothetical protein